MFFGLSDSNFDLWLLLYKLLVSFFSHEWFHQLLDFDASDSCFTLHLNTDDLLFGKNADKEVEICSNSSDTFLSLFLVEWLNSKLIFSFSLCVLTQGVEISIVICSLLLSSFFLFLSFCNSPCNFCCDSSCFWFSLDFCLHILFCFD